MCQFDYTCNVVADIADIDGIDEIVNCQLSIVDCRPSTLSMPTLSTSPTLPTHATAHCTDFMRAK